MQYSIFSLFAGVVLICIACSARLHTQRWQPDPTPDVTPRAPQPKPGRLTLSHCRDWEGYLPDPKHPEYLPERYLRVNFHVMDNSAGTAHRPPDSARVFLRRLLELANAQADTNENNWRSPDGVRILPKRYRYILTPQPVPGDEGIYFHYDDQLYYFVSMGKYQNNYDRRVIEKYAIGADSIINIFIQVHPRDSMTSATYRANEQGIALGTSLKIAGALERKIGPESFDGLLNHEVGHILGLSHAWTEDGCPDTNNHPNQCWAYSSEPPCRDLASDNMMDYNAYQIALTPCQIGRLQATLAGEGNPVRRCLVPTWCTLHEDRTAVIADSVAWTGARDLEGHVVIAPGGALYLSCRVSMPPGARITVQPGGRLWLDGCWLHNACGKSWQGIFVEEKNGLRGEVHTLHPPVIENVSEHSGP